MKLTISHIIQCFVFLSVAFAVCSSAAQDNHTSMSIDSPRPVADAVRKLEVIYVLPIDYEDIRSVNPSETKIDDQGHLGPKGASLSFDYTPPAPGASIETRKALALEATENLIHSFNTERGAAYFAVKTTTDGLDVTPVKSVDSAGNMEDLHALLDIHVTIPPAQRTATQLISVIADELWAASGRMTQVGILPTPLFHQHKTNITAQDEPARSVLHRLFNEMPMGYPSDPSPAGGVRVLPGASLAWLLMCGPPDIKPECFINVQTVSPAGRGAVTLDDAPPRATHAGVQ